MFTFLVTRDLAEIHRRRSRIGEPDPGARRVPRAGQRRRRERICLLAAIRLRDLRPAPVPRRAQAWSGACCGLRLDLVADQHLCHLETSLNSFRAAPASSAGMAASRSARGVLRRRRVAVAGRASRAIAPQTHKAQWKPPVSAAPRVWPSPSRVLKWVAATVDAIAMPIAPPSCWEGLSSPEASPASCLATPARPALEMGPKPKAVPAPRTKNGPARALQKCPCTGTCVAHRTPPAIRPIPAAITAP